MSEYLDVNTVSSVPTNFLRGVELVKRKTKELNMASENWPYPIMRFGDPENDEYYAEIWVNGMDWNYNYWLLESKELEKPQAHILMYFENTTHRDKINEYDFDNIVKGILVARREFYWFNHKTQENPFGWRFDSCWCYVKPVEPKKTVDGHDYMVKHLFQHANQERSEFFLNTDVVKGL